MTSGYSTATAWLTSITGIDPILSPTKKELAKDPILRDLKSMKDTEIKAYKSPPPKIIHNHHNVLMNHHQQQPKPKFVAHKDPTSKKKGGKVRGVSNRLGGEHMA